jgi:small GTP-binding protein
MIKKVCVLGDPGVGKTSIINRYVKDVFSPEYLSTIGARTCSKELELDAGKIVMSIWDIAGQQTSRSLSTSHYRGCQGVVYVYDLTSQESFDGLINWEHQLKKAVGEVPHVIVGNKLDLADPESIPEKRLPPGAKFKPNFFFTSAKTGDGLGKAFEHLGGLMLK